MDTLRRLLAVTVLFVPAAGQSLPGLKPDCIVRLEPPVYPPYEWGFEDQREIEISVGLNSDGKPVLPASSDSDHLVDEVRRVVSLSTYSTACSGRTLHLRFQFELRGENALDRTAAASFENEDRIVVVSSPPAALCDRRITTETEANECYGQGMRQSFARHYPEAIRCFDQKLSLAPEPEAYIERGIARRKSGQFGPAIEDYDQAIRLNPGSAIAYFDRGNVYKDMGQDQDAIRDYTEAIRIDPSRVEAYGNRALCYLARHLFQLAVQDFNKVVEMRPRDRKAYLNRGATYHEMNDPERAIADFDRAILLSPSEADAFNNRAAAYYVLGRYDRALEDYNAAVRLNPHYFEALLGRGDTLASMKRSRDAEADFTAAIRLRPDAAEAYQARATVRLEQGDAVGASSDLEKAKALQRSPNE
jgi:tetratricopeptide (TPR) repeat protein